MTDFDALPLQPLDQGQHPLQRRHERRHFGQLRTDMAINADDVEMRRGGGPDIDLQRPFRVNAEFILLQAGRDIRVGFGVDIGIDPQRHGRFPALRRSDLLQQGQFRFGLDIEAADACVQSALQFIVALAHPGKDDLARIAAGGQHPLQFSD